MWVKGELFDDFESVAASVHDRLDRAHQPFLFDRLTWFRMLWQHCPPGEFPIIARTRAENCDAWLFLANVDGRNAVGLGNWYTLSYRPIFTAETTDTTKIALLTALARRLASGPSRLSSITLSPVPERDGSVDVLRPFAVAVGMRSTTQKQQIGQPMSKARVSTAIGQSDRASCAARTTAS
jgi:hypothetical protein